VTVTADALIARLREHASADNVAGMARFGICSLGTLGVSMPVSRGIARDVKRDLRRDPEARHELAAGLWASGVHEARILAALVDVPALVTLEQADAWAADIDSWDICDQLCGELLGRSPVAWDLVERWTGRDEEFVKRAGFVVICALTVRDKVAPDEAFERFLPICEREAWDDRNFVRKAVNWAVRQIGKRDRHLNALAIACAERIRAQGSRSARWIAADALRELASPAVAARFDRAEGRR
jgi:3-methyladenine DNA glycosylase AlkD